MVTINIKTADVQVKIEVNGEDVKIDTFPRHVLTRSPGHGLVGWTNSLSPERTEQHSNQRRKGIRSVCTDFGIDQMYNNACEEYIKLKLLDLSKIGHFSVPIVPQEFGIPDNIAVSSAFKEFTDIRLAQEKHLLGMI